MDHDHVFIDERFHQDEESKSLIKKFADYSADQLNGVITNYISYEPGAVRAALYLSVQKGLISYDLEAQLRDQIESNFKKHQNHIRYFEWEKNNSFVKYISAWTDDQLYDIIENPVDIVIDVYFAVLTVAKERELISGEDFKTYCREARSGTLTEHYSNFNYAGQVPSGNSADLPGQEEVAEHTGDADFMEEIGEAEPIRKGYLMRSGFSLLVVGILVAVYEHNRTYYSSFAQHTRFLDVGFGIFMAIAGLIILLVGIWKHFNKGAD